MIAIYYNPSRLKKIVKIKGALAGTFFMRRGQVFISLNFDPEFKKCTELPLEEAETMIGKKIASLDKNEKL